MDGEVQGDFDGDGAPQQDGVLRSHVQIEPRVDGSISNTEEGNLQSCAPKPPIFLGSFDKILGPNEK
ncbi:hypothetical protein U1Q18_006646 [Sarracenia purpurea var. burkii]